MTFNASALAPWAATAVLTLVIGLLTLTPAVATMAAGNDKLAHLFAFLVLAMPLAMAYPRRMLVVFLAASAYGLSIELIQPYFGRAAEVADLVADVIGAALGTLAGGTLGMWRARRRRASA